MASAAGRMRPSLSVRPTKICPAQTPTTTSTTQTLGTLLLRRPRPRPRLRRHRHPLRPHRLLLTKSRQSHRPMPTQRSQNGRDSCA
jgi:hypothetical protein